MFDFRKFYYEAISEARKNTENMSLVRCTEKKIIDYQISVQLLSLYLSVKNTLGTAS